MAGKRVVDVQTAAEIFELLDEGGFCLKQFLSGVGFMLMNGENGKCDEFVECLVLATEKHLTDEVAEA